MGLVQKYSGVALNLSPVSISTTKFLN